MTNAVLCNLTRLIGRFNFKKLGKTGRTDFGVHTVAFMAAALDGEATGATGELKELIEGDVK